MFINFEGIDGCGKTTQAKMFAEHLRQNGIRDVVETFEPGRAIVASDGSTAASMRDVCFSKHLDTTSRTLAFFLDRSVHHQTVVEPTLRRGGVVVSDRGAASTWAYQVCGQDFPDYHFMNLVDIAIPTLPDVIVVIDLDPKDAKRRVILSRGDDPDEHPWNHDQEEFYQKVRKGYSDLYDGSLAHHVMHIKTTLNESPGQVHEKVMDSFSGWGLSLLRKAGYTR